jgi:hypothetical protein
MAGAIASVAGFGIGSVLTPVVNLRYDMKLAVAAVVLPHIVASAVRFWLLRKNIDRDVVKRFGLMSAAGGFTGAVLQQYVTGAGLTRLFAALLVFVGISGLTGWSERMRFGRRTAWVAGVVSGALGGLVGNQGGFRSAALLGFDVPPKAFVASSSAVAFLVDLARMPIYVYSERARLPPLIPLIAVASLGALAGTFAGQHVLMRLPPRLFRRLVSALILALGLYMFTR